MDPRLRLAALALALMTAACGRAHAHKAPERAAELASAAAAPATPPGSAAPVAERADIESSCSGAERSFAESMADLRAARLPSAEEVERVLIAYHCRYRDRSALIEIGRTHRGSPLLALAIGLGASSSHAGPSILIDGGIHGNEKLSTAFVLDAIAALLEPTEPRIERLLAEITVVAVPLVNPDGYEEAGKGRNPGRKNGRDNDNNGRPSPIDGVDLNRNYPFRWGALTKPWSSPRPIHFRYRGPEPASEPETQAMMRLANAEHFAAAISYHTGTLRLLVPYTIPNVQSPEPNVAWSIGKEVQRRSTAHPEGYVNVETRIYPVDGVEQDWLMHAHGTVALLIEGSSTAEVPAPRMPALLASIRSGWLALAERYLDGPTLSGRVLDTNGAPVEAEVMIDEIHLRERERWSSRCRDGYFDRFLPAPGRFHLRVRAADLPEVVREVDVPKGRVTIDVVVPGVVREPAECPTWTHAPGRDARLAPAR